MNLVGFSSFYNLYSSVFNIYFDLIEEYLGFIIFCF